MGIIDTMHASVAALELKIRTTREQSQTRAERIASELEPLRAWRIESAKRYVRPGAAPSSPPTAPTAEPTK
jgi:hypothetical protein